jgi:FtsP/CotA-like multicopper oxidase with cupredoxin domain
VYALAHAIAAPLSPALDRKGKRFPLAIAQRLDIIVDVPASTAVPVFAQVEGKRARTGIVLANPDATITKHQGFAEKVVPAVDLSLEGRLTAAAPLADRPVDNMLRLRLTGAMSSYIWSLNDELWPNVTPLTVRQGQRVAINIHNTTGMAHPMHLHGHAFQVVETNGFEWSGPLRDTVLVPPLADITIALDANNPGRWPLHCHNLYHQATGMMTEVIYA